MTPFSVETNIRIFTVNMLSNVCLCLQRCADMQEDNVRIVKGVDGRLTGEAYVHISGARAKLRLALAKDRNLMPVCDLFHTSGCIAVLSSCPFLLHYRVAACALQLSSVHQFHPVMVIQCASSLSRFQSCIDIAHQARPASGCSVAEADLLLCRLTTNIRRCSLAV